MNDLIGSDALSQIILLIVLTVCAISLFSYQTYYRLRQVARDKATVELQLRASELRYRAFLKAPPL